MQANARDSRQAVVVDAGTGSPTPTARHPAVDDIRDLLTFRIAMLAAASDRVGQRWLAAEFGLRLLEWRVLGLAATGDAPRFAEIALLLLVDKGQLSRVVTALTGRGLVAAEPDPSDLRTIRIRTTPAGKRLHRRVLDRATERNQGVVSALSPGELQTMFALLDKLQPHMIRRADTAG